MRHLPLVLLIACTPDDPADDPAVCSWGPTHTWEDNAVPDGIANAFARGVDTLGSDGVAYAILVDGEIRYAGAAGFADAANGVGMSPTTLLRSGSTLKMQTAAAALALEQQGL